MLNRAGIALAAAAFAFAPVAVQAETCGTIELGAAVSATGIYAANGKNTKNGYEFARQEDQRRRRREDRRQVLSLRDQILRR